MQSIIILSLLIVQTSAFLDIRGIRCEMFPNKTTRMDFFARDDPDSWNIKWSSKSGQFDPVASRSGLKLEENVEFFTELYGNVVSWVQIVDEGANRNDLYIHYRHNIFRNHFNLIDAIHVNYTSKVESPGEWWIHDHLYFHLTHAIDHNCNYRWFFYGIHWFWLKATIYLYTNPESDDWTYRRRLQAYFDTDRNRFSKFIINLAPDWWTEDGRSVGFYGDGRVVDSTAKALLDLGWADDSLVKHIETVYDKSKPLIFTKTDLYVDDIVYPVPNW